MRKAVGFGFLFLFGVLLGMGDIESAKAATQPDIVIAVPDSIDLSYDSDKKSFVGISEISAYGNSGTGGRLTVTVPTSATYKNTNDEAVKADAVVSFGTNGVDSWSDTELSDGKTDTSSIKTSTIKIEVPLSEITTAGDYSTQFSISSDLTVGSFPPEFVEVYISTSNRADMGYTSGSSSFTIPETYTKDDTKYKVVGIDTSAFSGETSLQSITIPESVKEIRDKAFYGCTALGSVSIPNSVTTLGTEVFRGCTGMTTASVSDSITTMGEGCFRECSNLATANISKGLTALPAQTFRESGLTSIDIPNGVIESGKSSFYGCKKLQSVTMGNSFEIPGYYMFNDCTSLSSISLSDNLKFISYCMFENDSKLKSIDIPSTVEYADSYAFKSTGLTSINFSDASGLTSIGYECFRNCSSLTTVDFTGCNNMQMIDSYAFYDLSKLSNVTFTTSPKSIGSRAFYEDYNLGINGSHCLNFPEGLETIGDYAFAYLDNYSESEAIRGISFPSSLRTIGESAFKCCTYVKTVTIPEGCQKISDEAFYSLSRVSSLVVPSTVTYIGYSAFDDLGCLVTSNPWSKADLTINVTYDYAKSHYNYNMLGLQFKTGINWVVHFTDQDYTFRAPFTSW